MGLKEPFATCGIVVDVGKPETQGNTCRLRGTVYCSFSLCNFKTQRFDISKTGKNPTDAYQKSVNEAHRKGTGAKCASGRKKP